VEDYKAIARGDVAATFGSSGHPVVGFMLTVVEDTETVMKNGRATTEVTVASVGEKETSPQIPIVVTVEGHHSARTVKGWIEQVTPICRRLVRLPASNGYAFTGRLQFLLDPRPQAGRIVCRRETSPLIELGEGRFEAFTAGVASLLAVKDEEAQPILVALYSRTVMAVIEASAYRWNSGKFDKENPVHVSGMGSEKSAIHSNSEGGMHDP
jgi:hypothetical protein